MQIIERQKTLSFGARALYELVNDTPRYADFAPYCVAGRVLEENGMVKMAELDFSAAGITQTLRTRNINQPFSRIDVEMVSGPLKSLNGYWLFEAIDAENTRVSIHFELDFGFSLMANMIRPLLEVAVNHMVEDFSNYAKRVLSAD